jgi:tetratricopeptide (TPR) repeat protein
MRHRILLLTVAACLIAASAHAQNETTDQIAAPANLAPSCGAAINATPDARIAACDTAIESRTDASATDRAALFVSRAEAYDDKGDMDRAIADLNKAIELDPKNVTAFENRGTLFVRSGKPDRAIEDYNEAIRLDPHYAQAYADRGVAYYVKGDHARAIDNYSEAIRLDPKHAVSYSNRAAAYKKAGRNDRAIADESEAIKLDPSRAEFYDNRGLSYAHNRDFDLAIADYDKAISLKAEAKFFTNRGNAYQYKGNLDRAIADYGDAIRIDPKFPLAWNNRGAAYKRKGDLEAALSNYEQAITLSPRMATAVENRDAIRNQIAQRDAEASPQTPTFDCRVAKRAVEKAICSDPNLRKLDWEADQAFRSALLRVDAKGATSLRRAQRAFIERRNTKFGSPNYNFKAELERQIAKLRAVK